MRVYDAYEFVREGNSETAALANGRSGRSGWGGRLAFLFAVLSVGLCAWAWANNDNIVAWSLSQGIVKEAATRTLPSAVKVVSVAGGILGLTAIGLALRPVRSAVGTVLVYMGLGISTVFRPLWLGIYAIAQLVALVLRHAWRGVTVVAQAVDLALRYLWMGVSTVLGYLGRGVAVAARAVGLALGYAWVKISVAFGFLWRAIVAVAHGVSLALYYLLGGILIVLYLLWLGVAAVLDYLQRGIAIVAQAVGLALRYAWVKVCAALGYAWQGIVAIVALAVGLTPNPPKDVLGDSP